MHPGGAQLGTRSGRGGEIDTLKLPEAADTVLPGRFTFVPRTISTPLLPGYIVAALPSCSRTSDTDTFGGAGGAGGGGGGGGSCGFGNCATAAAGAMVPSAATNIKLETNILSRM
jgi:hypothetical protein